VRFSHLTPDLSPGGDGSKLRSERTCPDREQFPSPLGEAARDEVK
jgi:hypothetical protein